MFDDCCEEVRKLKVCHLKAHVAVADKLCAKELDGNKANLEDLVANNICAQSVLGHQVSANNLNANALCSKEGVINKLCVEELNVGKLMHCEEVRAAVTNSADSIYVLGSLINWDLIINDPNNNVALAPFSYTVPVSGYYLTSFHLVHDQLAGGPINGTPIGRLEMMVNGNELRSLYVPFLSFSDKQQANLTSMGLLQAGDVITMKYHVLIFDLASGFVPYVGTVNLKANGAFPALSGFAIHLLSNLDCQPGAVCPQCPAVEVPCQPIQVICDPCHPEPQPEPSCDPEVIVKPQVAVAEKAACAPCQKPAQSQEQAKAALQQQSGGFVNIA